MRRIAVALLALLALVACDQNQPAKPDPAPTPEQKSDQPPVPEPEKATQPAVGESDVRGAAGGADNVPADPGKTNGPDVVTISKEEAENRALQDRLALPFYPNARRVPSLSSVKAGAVRVLLCTDDAPEAVVRFYEQRTGKMAQSTELSDGSIYDIVLAQVEGLSGEGGAPLHGIQIRPTPEALQGSGVAGKTSIILFRKAKQKQAPKGSPEAKQPPASP